MIDSNNITNTNSQILIETAQRMGIAVELLNKERVKLRLTKNGKTHIVTDKSFGINSSAAIKLTRNKKRVTEILKKNNIPTPKEIEIQSLKDLKTAKLPPFPLVLKPSEGQKAHDVYVGIKDKETLIKLVKKHLAEKAPPFYKDGPCNQYPQLVIQKFIKGQDLRFFVLNRKVIGIVKRHPPTLTGDGKSTIKELVEAHNQKLLDDRQHNGRRMQNRLLNWSRINWHINNQGFLMSTILPQGKTIEIFPISNFQAGGTVETVPVKNIPQSIISLAEKVSTLTNLTICGVDMIITRTGLVNQQQGPSLPKGTFVIEVNSDPSLRLHEWPNRGTPQPVSQKLLEFIFNH